MKDEDRRFLLVHAVDKIYSLLALVVKFGFPSWVIVSVAKELAGKTTLANVAISVFKGYTALVWLLIPAAAVVWALVERDLRKRKTAYLYRRIKHLEQKLDPNRSSSALMEAGDTNPTDK